MAVLENPHTTTPDIITLRACAFRGPRVRSMECTRPQIDATSNKLSLIPQKVIIGAGGYYGGRLLRPCILQCIINFPGSRRSSRRPLEAAQTVYFTMYY